MAALAVMLAIVVVLLSFLVLVVVVAVFVAMPHCTQQQHEQTIVSVEGFP